MASSLGLFTELARGPLQIEETEKRVGLHPRSARDFLNTLVVTGMLERDGQISSNSNETEFYLDRAKPTYIGTFFELWNARQYPMFAALSDGLATGRPQNEIERGEEDWVEAMYTNPERLRVFLRGMTGHSLPSAMAIARKFVGPNTRPSPISALPRDAFLYKLHLPIRTSQAKVSIFLLSVRSLENTSRPSICRIESAFPPATSLPILYRAPKFSLWARSSTIGT
jgi:hypothetical protein